MNRNIGFFISSNDVDDAKYLKAKKHFTELARHYELNISSFEYKKIHIHIIYQNNLTIIEHPNEEGGGYSFPIGNLGNNVIENDRYLKISIKQNSINIINDYAGTIPVFYSLRKYISISNIEPCVVIDSKTNDNDLSLENIYGYLRYMHFIWDETAYIHINTALPDSETIFDTNTLIAKSNYLKTISSKMLLSNANDKQVAAGLFELNEHLVKNSLNNYDKIILPLSSGYDSRMIFAALSGDNNFKNRLNCYTYGGIGSVEVEAARELAKTQSINWHSIDLPLNFLEKNMLKDIFDIFGSSLHMHGMYQIDFFKEICKLNINLSNTCLTSGFMTGVPAGQHNHILNIKSNADILVSAMNKFSQSKTWQNDELEQINEFRGENFIDSAETRFRKAFDRFDGEVFQKSIIFDIWTRQRNFISYYPRTYEWLVPTVSPHMNIEYINFFMSLSKEHLLYRRAVELMFSIHYSKIAGIISNSNGIKSITNPLENILFSFSHKLKRIKMSNLIPRKYQNYFIDFDILALKNAGKEGIYPLFEYYKYKNNILGKIFSNRIESLFTEAINGNSKSYQKLVLLQSLVWSSIYSSE
jgi:hypothetical protein